MASRRFSVPLVFFGTSTDPVPSFRRTPVADALPAPRHVQPANGAACGKHDCAIDCVVMECICIALISWGLSACSLFVLQYLIEMNHTRYGLTLAAHDSVTIARCAHAGTLGDCMPRTWRSTSTRVQRSRATPQGLYMLADTLRVSIIHSLALCPPCPQTFFRAFFCSLERALLISRRSTVLTNT
jgi:hypothetical protein